MARECRICNKKGMLTWRRAKLRGKYNPTAKKRQQPNLQWVIVPLNLKTKKEAFKKMEGKRVLACSKCRKTVIKYSS